MIHQERVNPSSTSMRKILIQIDSDRQPSVFDAVVALDAGIDHLLPYGGVVADQVRDLVHGAIFTRGPQDLKSTAIFIGGQNVAVGEALLEEVVKAFFGPLRVSVMLDPNGCNTTAAAAVLRAAKHLDLPRSRALVLGATGPVGQRVCRLLARRGAQVRVGSRLRDRAAQVAERIGTAAGGDRLEPVVAGSPDEVAAALEGRDLAVAAGAAGVQLLPVAQWSACKSLKVMIDLNAVPPLGIEGVQVTDKAKDRCGVLAYGAIGVGGTKMKIHKAAIARLFESNDHVLDAESILQIGLSLESQGG
ncbi:MAG: bifunctional NADP-dependent methylenetetrahydromethanopterin dehydrogenase/methylenetetrahydrofolate dehydrogenase [Planctomycetes bacterium]|nr:bifunctional NADP-dependent methylenetetrahydromethanopterin dehydrogenase/methylenetetrahydrofolate dehydrogenase [Planctomycetota bacterium]